MNVIHTSETSREDFPTVKTGYVHGIERLNKRTTLQKEVEYEIFEILQPWNHIQIRFIAMLMIATFRDDLQRT